MIDPVTMADIRGRINPYYKDVVGTESHERKLLVDEIDRLKQAIISALDNNRHLANGDDCTLIDLKRSVPEWEENNDEGE